MAQVISQLPTPAAVRLWFPKFLKKFNAHYKINQNDELAEAYIDDYLRILTADMKILGPNAKLMHNRDVQALVPNKGDVVEIVGWCVWGEEGSEYFQRRWVQSRGANGKYDDSEFIPNKERHPEISKYTIFRVKDRAQFMQIIDMSDPTAKKGPAVKTTEREEYTFYDEGEVRPGEIWWAEDRGPGRYQNFGILRDDDNGNGAIVGDTGDNSYEFIAWI